MYAQKQHKHYTYVCKMKTRAHTQTQVHTHADTRAHTLPSILWEDFLSPCIFQHIPWDGTNYSAPMSPTAHIFYNFLPFTLVGSYPSHTSLSLFFKPFTAHLLSCKQSLTKDQTPFPVLAAQQDPQPPPIPLFPLFM